MLMTFANSLDPDQAKQNIVPGLDPNCLTLSGFSEIFFENIKFLRKKSTDEKTCKITAACK